MWYCVGRSCVNMKGELGKPTAQASTTIDSLCRRLLVSCLVNPDTNCSSSHHPEEYVYQLEVVMDV